MPLPKFKISKTNAINKTESNFSVRGHVQKDDLYGLAYQSSSGLLLCSLYVVAFFPAADDSGWLWVQ